MAFSEMLNFKVRQFKRFDGGWGALDKETGQWSGMILNLINGEADFISASLNQCCMRTEPLDFLWALSQVRDGFAIKSKHVSNERRLIQKLKHRESFKSKNLYLLLILGIRKIYWKNSNIREKIDF